MTKLNISRRDFLIGSAGALAAAHLVPSHLLAQTNDLIRIAYHPAYTRVHAMHIANLVQEQEFDPEWIKFTTGTATTYAFQGGSVDVGVLGIPPILGALANGQNLKVIAIDSDYSSGEGLVAAPNSGIEAIQDIRGKTIGTIKGGSAHFSLWSALQKSGINPDELEILFLDGATIVPAFTAGDIDAAWIFQPFWYMLADKGGQHIITDKELGIPAIGLWIARGEWIADKPEDCVNFLIAFEKGEEAKRKNREEVIDRLMSTIGLSAEIAERLYTSDTLVGLKDQVRADYSLSIMAGSDKGLGAFLNEEASFLAEQGILTLKPDAGSAIDSSCAVEAVKRIYG